MSAFETTVSVQGEGDWHVVRISGPIEGLAVGRIRDKVTEYLQENEFADSLRWIVIDLSAVGSIGVHGIEMLTALSKRAVANKAERRAIVASGRVRGLIDADIAAAFYERYDTLKTALAERYSVGSLS